MLTSCATHTPNNHLNASSKPNILFIYTDDQAPWAAGFTGNKDAITPNIDALAQSGMSLPNAYTTTPVCSPSRAGLLTSRYGYELGIHDWINLDRKTLSGNEPDLGLDPKLETWPEALQRAGYHTGLIGKWHLGVKDEFHPNQHGFDEFFGFREGGTSPADPNLEDEDGIRQYEGLTADILTDHAIQFLETNRTKPFMLSLNYRAPHARWLPVSEEDAAPYENHTFTLPHPEYPNLDTKRAQRMMKEYLSSVRSVDRNIGRIMQVLREQNSLENTVVIFTSDHGYNMAHNGIWHKGNGTWLLKSPPEATPNVPRNQRPNLYDNSIKVPTIISWPNHIPAASQNHSSVSNLDWFPTLLDIAHTQKQDDTLVRGSSFIEIFSDPNKIVSSDYYVAYSTLHQSITHMRAYSDGHHKLVRDFKNPERSEFYDLKKDPSESVNLIDRLSADQHKIVDAFDQKIVTKMLETQDPIYALLCHKPARSTQTAKACNQ